MEILYPEHNSRNSVRELTVTKLDVLHNAHPNRNIGSAKRGEPSEAKSGKPINVVHMSSTFASSLTTAIIFRRIGSMIAIEKEVFICQWTNKTGQGSGS